MSEPSYVAKALDLLGQLLGPVATGVFVEAGEATDGSDPLIAALRDRGWVVAADGASDVDLLRMAPTAGVDGPAAAWRSMRPAVVLLPPGADDRALRAAGFVRVDGGPDAVLLLAGERRAELIARLTRADERPLASGSDGTRGSHALARARHDIERLRERVAAAEGARAAAEARRDGLDAALRALLDEERARASALEREAVAFARFREELRWPEAPRALRAVLPVARALRRLSAARRRSAPAAAVAMAVAVDVAAPPIAVTPPAAPGRAAPPRRSATGEAGPAPVRDTVHVYHHATAPHDAVSRSLFVQRDALRSMGFRSDIFSRHGHTDHTEVRPLDELPQHDGFVLIVHHSLGDVSIDRLFGRPFPVILFYHNVTPAALFAQKPWFAPLAALGREQLGYWRRRAAVALAPSAHNAIELRRAGFRQPVGVCPLLLDVAVLRRRAATVRPDHAARPFTVLFVGRLATSKNQRELVDAFAVFRARHGEASRLRLVGYDDGPDSPMLRAVTERVRAHGLADAVEFAGPLADAALDRAYAEADLYASMSLHEGFGVPLLEAMAFGLPVIACRAGAVASTLGGAGLLVDGGAAAMGEAMARLATDEAARARMRAAGLRRLDDFAVARALPALREALLIAGAVPPAPEPVEAAELHVTVAGHVNGSYSLAAVNRRVALALEAVAPGRTALLPVEEVADAPLLDAGADGEALAALAARLPVRAAPHAVVSGHYPVHAPGEKELEQAPDLLCAYFFWEESLVPPETIAALAAGFDAVLAPSRFVARALLDSGLCLPVRTVGFAPDLAPFAALPGRAARARGRTPFTFLHVSSAFPRKGVDVLLAAWAEAFGAADPVRLVIKSFPNPHNTVAADIAALRARCGARLAPLVHHEVDLDAAAVRALFADADAIVLPTRGEGFNIPAAEALAAGLPLVVSAEGGHRDFVSADMAVLVDGRHVPARTHLSTPGSLLFEPDPAALARALRAVVAEGDAARARAGRAQRAVLAALDADRFAHGVRQTLAELLPLPPPAMPGRITVVSSWEVRCGIAGYTRFLLDAREADGAELTVLCDRRTAVAPGVVPCWSPGDPASAAGIATALAAADPEVVLVQHHPGLLPWLHLAELLEDGRLQDRVVAVTLHNTAHLGTLAPDERSRVRAALAGCDRVIVHRIDEMDALRSAGVAGATAIPQGVPARIAAAPARTGGAPVIGAYGFLLPPKGFGALVDAVAILRAARGDVRLRMVTAHYDEAHSAPLEAELRARAAAAGIADAIEWHTDFLPHEASLALLAGCDAVAMPYEPTGESSSAALRVVLASGRPTVVTPLAIFAEAADAVLVAGGGDGAALAAALGRVLDEAELRARLAAAQADWVDARNWPAIARRTFGMLAALHCNRDAPAPPAGQGVVAEAPAATASTAASQRGASAGTW